MIGVTTWGVIQLDPYRRAYCQKVVIAAQSEIACNCSNSPPVARFAGDLGLRYIRDESIRFPLCQPENLLLRVPPATNAVRPFRTNGSTTQMATSRGVIWAGSPDNFLAPTRFRGGEDLGLPWPHGQPFPNASISPVLPRL